MTPSVDHVLDWLRSGHIKPDPAAMNEPDFDRRAKAMAACFDAYPDVLDTILRMTVFRAPVDHRLAEHEYLKFAQLREGQNQVAAGIVHYLDRAKDLERKDRETPNDGSADLLPGGRGGWGDPGGSSGPGTGGADISGGASASDPALWFADTGPGDAVTG